MAMSYWSKYFFSDRKFWLKYLIIGIGFLLFLDVISYLLNPPGYFNLWPLKIALFLSVPISAGIIYINFKTLSRINKTKREFSLFEKMREEEIRKIVESDAAFATFCYECVFFNPDTRACRRDRIYERVKEIRIGNRQYCLYWEKNDQNSINEKGEISEY